MLSGLSRCVANPGRLVARVPHRMVNTLSTGNHERQLLAPFASNGQFVQSHMSSKQSVTEDIDAILHGLFHHSARHQCAEPAYLGARGTSIAPSSWVPIQGFFDPSVFSVEDISFMNRNSRRPKRANHGARPCSRSSRRYKKEQIGKRRRG
jgi:hypothetical protein